MGNFGKWCRTLFPADGEEEGYLSTISHQWLVEACWGWVGMNSSPELTGVGWEKPPGRVLASCSWKLSGRQTRDWGARYGPGTDS